MAYRVSDIDIRLLRVFCAVVECRGFSSAQSVLNTSQSTISSQMSHLEDRLGIRLCERGRTGFKLTSKGTQVYEEVQELFKAHERFQNVTSGLKGSLNGFLNLAVIDNVANDTTCPIVEALNRFNMRDHDVTIKLEILTPAEIERGLMDGTLDLAIGTFHHQMPGLNYQRIYTEPNELVCGATHPIFAMTDEKAIRKAVANARKVTRGYLDGGDLLSIESQSQRSNAVVQNLEATSLLVLGGGHIGFLPKHVSRHWVDQGRMKPILPSRYSFETGFALVTRKKLPNSLILKCFMEDMDKAISEIEQTPA